MCLCGIYLTLNTLPGALDIEVFYPSQTLLSLSKLSILASESPDVTKLSFIDAELTKVEYQKKIPVDCLEVCSNDRCWRSV